jgi:hypothetical protein
MSGKDVVAQAKGNVGLDGKLDLPVTLRFSPELSKKLKKACFGKRPKRYVANFSTVRNSYYCYLCRPCRFYVFCPITPHLFSHQ